MARQAFVKYHGAGNDFIIMDGRNLPGVIPTEEVARLCHRHFGIGADGLIIISPTEESGVDYHMLYYNADGLESSMCGNGARCAYHYAVAIGVAGEEAVFRAFDGLHSAQVLAEGGIRISMTDVQDISEPASDTYVLNTGSPHVVNFVGELDSIDAFTAGRTIRNSVDYKREGINVNFVEVVGPAALRIRTYERGVEDLTLACGTGVTAAALAFARKTGIAAGPVQVQADGGDLSVDFTLRQGSFEDVFLTGPVQLVFKGETEVHF